MKSMIYGAGSLGTILGALLSEKGADVTLVSRNADHINRMKEAGATIVGGMEKTIPVKACLPNEIEGKFDLIFLMTKQTGNAGTAQALLPYLSETGVFCCMQNGIPELNLRGVVPDEKILGAIIQWSATFRGPGVSELTSPGDSVNFILGSLISPNEERLELTKEYLSLAGETVIDPDLIALRWSKLLVNAAVSAFSSSLGLSCGGILGSERMRDLSLSLLRECIDVGHAHGVVFRPVNGYDIAGLLYAPSPEQVPDREARMHEAFDPIANAVSSILQDLRRGRKTEIHAISGIVCREGRALGIPTPYNDRVVQVIERIESGELGCSEINLAEYADLP